MGWIVNPPWPPELIAQNEFDVDRFLDGMRGQGAKVLLEKASECPCSLNGDSDHPSPDCPVCLGDRYEYHSPVETWAVVTALSNQPEILKALGPWTLGMASVTTRSEHLMAVRDRITMLEQYRVALALVTRGSGVVDVLRHRAIHRELVVTPEGEVQRRAVEHLRLADSETGLGGSLLEEGIDFEVNEDGLLDWTLGIANGTAPQPGQRYAIRYFTRPRYIVESMPYSWRQGRKVLDNPTVERMRQELPCKALARLDNSGLRSPSMPME